MDEIPDYYIWPEYYDEQEGTDMADMDEEYDDDDDDYFDYGVCPEHDEYICEICGCHSCMDEDLETEYDEVWDDVEEEE